MMKKGFTLAEVLITLAIIGVVATMVLPGVLISVNEQQSKTAIKKAVNVLTTIAKMNEAIDGYDYTGTNVSSTGDSDQSVFSMITRRGDIDWTQMSDRLTSYKPASGALPGASSNNYVIFFKDGSYVSFPADTVGTNTATLQGDNLPEGFPVLYDMNGAKSPNFLSNCGGAAALKADDASAKDNVALTECNDKTKRVIKDQFGLKIRGNTVQPNGAASKWLYQN